VKLVASLGPDVRLLCSPPWGGPEYISKEVFSVKDLGIFGEQAFNVAKRISGDVAFFLPRNTNVDEVGMDSVQRRCNLFDFKPGV